MTAARPQARLLAKQLKEIVWVMYRCANPKPCPYCDRAVAQAVACADDIVAVLSDVKTGKHSASTTRGRHR